MLTCLYLALLELACASSVGEIDKQEYEEKKAAIASPR
jgi:hypothetical protein